MLVRLVSVVLLLGLRSGCATQSGPDQQTGIRLPNCNVGVVGRNPPVNCHTSGVVLSVGR
jgi:hypothetical protein